MLLAFLVFALSTLGFLTMNKSSRRGWVLLVGLAGVFCVLIAVLSVSAVWFPRPLSDDVFSSQDSLGEYEGDFPLAKLLYPFYLNVYHTPFDQQKFGRYGEGNASFSVFFDGARILKANGVFMYGLVMGPRPLGYIIDFVFSDSDSFYYFLLVLFALVNAVGAFLGIVVGKALARRIHGSPKQVASGGQMKSQVS